MKTTDELREFLEDRGFEETTFFENPSFVEAIVGVTDDGNLIYEYEKMITSLKDEEGWDDTEAIEWIAYNTIRTIPYMGSSHPIIMYPIEE